MIPKVDLPAGAWALKRWPLREGLPPSRLGAQREDSEALFLTSSGFVHPDAQTAVALASPTRRRPSSTAASRTRR